MAARTHTSSRIVVVGGGVSGLAIAVRLAQAGLPVTVLESSELGFGSSTRNQGWLYSGAWFAPDQPDLARLCYESLEQTLQFCPACQEPGHDSMIWLFAERETDVTRWTAAWRAVGIPYQEVPAWQLARQIPALASSRVQQAFQLPDRAIRYDLLLRRLADVAMSTGVEIRGGTRVDRLALDDERVHGVVTGQGEQIAARLVILAGNAAGLGLIPGFGEHGFGPQEVGRQPSYKLVALKTHLLAIRPEISRWPFCVANADGLNHMPHAPVSVLGTGRWLPVADPENQKVDVTEIERIWDHLGRFFPNLRRDECESRQWAGTTVQAMHADQIDPGRIPLPTVIDYEREPEGVRNLLSVFPGRATLWAHLADQTQQVVLQKLDSAPATISEPPWARFGKGAGAPSAGEVEQLHVIIYHCQTCGHVAHREPGIEPPVCCGAAMARAAENSIERHAAANLPGGTTRGGARVSLPRLISYGGTGG